ncbi:MAG: hypothetical protein ABL921_21655, partial [Pirellula sp.]
YGFLSPRFEAKTGITAQELRFAISNSAANCEAILCPVGWDQLAYFANPFEQGEMWHGGLMDLTQQFLQHLTIPLDLRSLVTYSKTSVFSNYVIAKPRYWRAWLGLADAFFDYVERGASAEAIRQTTNYGSVLHQTPMKVFIQERLASLVLSQGGFGAEVVRCQEPWPVYDRLFVSHTLDGTPVHQVLQTCDWLKMRYVHTGDDTYLQTYRKARASIRFKLPLASNPI